MVKMNQKEIGGYFSLELDLCEEYHKNAISLNNARAGLQYLLRSKKYKKIYLPYYICGCVLQPITAENIEYEYYHINKQFEPIFDKKIFGDECFYYVNYFGINSSNVKSICDRYNNVIIDNTQAFYSMPEAGVDTIYSPRKFFGVPDGGYLYTNTYLDEIFIKDISYSRMKHLLKRIDLSANEGYTSFQDDEKLLDNAGIKFMSNLTKRILCSIDYEKCAVQRIDNFLNLENTLKKYNLLDLPSLNSQVPMVYPFMVENNNLRNFLIQNKIYIPTYWKDVLKNVNKESIEAKYTNCMLPLPIDQRYDGADMKVIVDNILAFLE